MTDPYVIRCQWVDQAAPSNQCRHPLDHEGDHEYEETLCGYAEGPDSSRAYCTRPHGHPGRHQLDEHRHNWRFVSATYGETCTCGARREPPA